MIAFIDETYMSREEQRSGFHESVLLEATVRALQPAPGKIFFDGTVGGAGHAFALLEKGASLVACDQDPDAIAEASHRLSRYRERVRLLQVNFADALVEFRRLGIEAFHGVLLDLGVSSHQIDTPTRGFSFQADGPLDMRMNPASRRTAADCVNQASEEQLARIFFEYGEEPAARRIAAHLVRERARRPFRRTQELAQAVEAIVPRRGSRHPATRVFQALRIAVNNELTVLEQALPGLSRRITPGGRMAVITFHSLEDRIVKHYFREVSREWIDRPEWPERRRNPKYAFRLITARPVEPSQEEVARNPRARSAKLRVIERNSNES
ncbi:MAG: 16S rRNA (cytosine(1402)-N(4))-methyltransferase RsmH [Chthoniobacterales bacterium]